MPNFLFGSLFKRVKSVTTDTQLKMATPNNNNTKRSGNQGGKKQRWKGRKSTNTNTKETFKGECDDLKGKVYYIGSAKQADNYNTTTEAIMEYILREFTHGLDVVESLEALKEKDFTNDTPVEGTPPEDASDALKTALKQSIQKK